MSDAASADRLRHLEAENARLRQLLDQQGVSTVLRHQVRNTLGMMRAILRQSAEYKSTATELAAHVEGRFDALLRVQTALLSSPDGRLDLGTLVCDQLLAETIKEGERATVSGPPVRADARQAEMLAIALHELAANAIKFGAMRTLEGRIDVTWDLTSSPARLTIVWAETGPPRTMADAPVRGFGTEVIEGMLPYQLKATSRLELLAEGMRCTIALPLATSS
jgi:two-component sensor histidine kinase